MDQSARGELRQPGFPAPTAPQHHENFQTPISSPEKQTSLSARHAPLFPLSEYASASRHHSALSAFLQSRRQSGSLPRGLRQPSAHRSFSASSMTGRVTTAPHARQDR